MFSLVAAGMILASAPTAREVTIYNQGFALIKEVRSFNLKQGRQTVAVEDVASMIDPSSVGIRSLTGADSFNVLEQNYQFDLISPLAILNKSVGQRIKFIRTIGGQRDVLEGILLNAPTSIVPDGNGNSQQTYSGMVIRTDDGRIVLSPSGEIEVREVPNGLISKPTLLWDLEATKAGANDVELSYITNGIQWSADYVMTLGDKKANFKGWVTVNNQSGANFEEAKMKLLAGDVNRAQRGSGGGFGGGRAEAMKADTGFREESLFEYHLYTLQRPSTIRNKEIKQLSLLEGSDIAFEKKLIVDAMQNYGSYYPSEGEVGSGNISPQVRIEFVNSKENGMGMALPAGRVRLYQRDASGSVQMLGEDQINHTPRNEKLSLVVGRSFDVVATRKRTNFQRLGNNAFRETFEIEVRNRKEVADTVYVLERHWGDWRVTEKNMDFTKLDSNSMQFDVPLKPNEVKTVTYTVETRW